jgi:hypothetical protein
MVSRPDPIDPDSQYMIFHEGFPKGHLLAPGRVLKELLDRQLIEWTDHGFRVTEGGVEYVRRMRRQGDRSN